MEVSVFIVEYNKLNKFPFKRKKEMIDTIKGYIDIRNRKINDFQSIIKDGKVSSSQKGYSVTINLSNFKITLRLVDMVPVRINFNGSLPKLYYGNNLAQLDWNDTRLAIQMLSDTLDIDFSRARLTRVDFGINLVMEYEVYEYLNCLLSFPRLDRYCFPSTVKFTKRHSSKHLQFYDKTKEIKAKNSRTLIEIPSEFKSKNILRYEIQLQKKLEYILNHSEPSLRHLLDEKVQKRILDIWVRSYSKVNKLQPGLDPQYLLDNHNGLLKYLAYKGIEKIGAENLNNIIAQKNFNVKNVASKRSKLKYVVRELASEVRMSTLDKGLIGELDTKIESSRELIF